MLVRRTSVSKVIMLRGYFDICCSQGGPPQILRSQFGTTCCPIGTTPGLEEGVYLKCYPNAVGPQRKRDHLAYDLSTRPVRRGIEDDPARSLSFRPGTWRARMSPKLLAEAVTNDWRFEYR